MRRNQIYFIAVLAIIIIVLFGFQYFVSIYEVDIVTEPEVLFADNTSVCLIRTVPLNSFGWKVPFRKASAQIEIREGSDLVDIVKLDEDNGIIKIKAREKTGIVVIYIKPEKALLPSSVEVKILPNQA
jgi:hypothetical protein